MSEEWRDLAACWDHPTPQIFFNPQRPTGLRVCVTCTVTAECLDYANRLQKTSQAVVGVWGGTTFHSTRKRGTKRV